MNELINVIKNEKGQLVVSSREIATNFNKDHKHVLESISNLINGVDENSADLFIESKYQHPQNKQWYKEYLLTRDGFSLLVMGFTGAKALEWKLKYIKAFNKMEEHIKSQAINTSELSPELQMFKQIFDTVAKQQLENKQMKEEIKETKEEIKGIREIVALTPNAWRKDTSSLISKIAMKLGGFDHIKDVREESYKILNETYKVDVNRRLLNKKKNMALEGCSKSKINKLNCLDVIADDEKLINGYISIISKLAIKYGVGGNNNV